MVMPSVWWWLDLQSIRFLLDVPRLGLGLVNKNPTCDGRGAIGEFRLKRRLIQFKGYVANVVGASGRGVSFCAHHVDRRGC